MEAQQALTLSPPGTPASIDSSSVASSAGGDEPILHILVIGFHHKKGCQVEFSYPPLMPPPPSTVDESVEANEADAVPASDCPPGWKYLPTLALPDGSHNFAYDSVFFNLPSLTDPDRTVFGVSCYRQIPVDQLKIRTADVTRSTVQKSVCILASLPVYGYVEVKLALIAQSYFEQGDFAHTDLLTGAYRQLNACLRDVCGPPPPSLHQQLFVGLPLREIALRWRHSLLLLFKLLLLEKRVVVFGSPVRPVSALILAVVSLHAGQLEAGMQRAASVRTVRAMSPMPTFGRPAAGELALEATERSTADGDGLSQMSVSSASVASATSVASSSADENDGDPKTPPADGADRTVPKFAIGREESVDVLSDRLQPLCTQAASIWRAPYPMFRNGHLCLPYLSLPYMDLLGDEAVRAYIIGTSNILFRQKRQLADVFVDVESATIRTEHADVRRQLQLSTEDLRFMDHVLRHVQQPREAAEGSERWIRDQFRAYTAALLRTAAAFDRQQHSMRSVSDRDVDEIATDAVAQGSAAMSAASNGIIGKDVEQFNGTYVAELMRTEGWRDWMRSMSETRAVIEDAIDDNAADDDDRTALQRFETDVAVGHPFAGSSSVSADLKLRLSQTMNNSESGRRINQAVNTTSKAVGGAISQAKDAFSTWFSSLSGNHSQSLNANRDLDGEEQPHSSVDATASANGTDASES